MSLLPHVGGECLCARDVVGLDCHREAVTDVRELLELSNERLGKVAAQATDARREARTRAEELQKATGAAFDLQDRLTASEEVLREIRSLTLDKYAFLEAPGSMREQIQTLAVRGLGEETLRLEHTE